MASARSKHEHEYNTIRTYELFESHITRRNQKHKYLYLSQHCRMLRERHDLILKIFDVPDLKNTRHEKHDSNG
jgi:hypothetical protein